MRKYKAPGVYSTFIPAEQPVDSSTPQRVMSLVGTGKQSFDVVDELITRSNSSIFDKLAKSNVTEIYSITSNPISAKTSITNKEYTNFSLEKDCVVWNPISGASYDSTYSIKTTAGNGSFATNIKVEITDNKFIENEAYIITISYVGKEKQGTFTVTKASNNEILGEYVASSIPFENIISGVKLSVFSTFVLDNTQEDSRISKTNIGDAVTIQFKSAKCHVEATTNLLTETYSKDSAIKVNHGGSYYNIVGDGKSVVDTVEKWPSLTNKYNFSKDFDKLQLKVKLYKEKELANFSDIFTKFAIKMKGKLQGVEVSKTQILFEENSDPVNEFVVSNLLESDKKYFTVKVDDELDITYSYVLKDNVSFDQTDLLINSSLTDVSEIVTDESDDNKEENPDSGNENPAPNPDESGENSGSEGGSEEVPSGDITVHKMSLMALSEDVPEEILLSAIDNGIYIRNDVIPHTVSNDNEVFNNLIKNLKINNSDNAKTGSYKIKINNLNDNQISIYDITNEKLIGTYSAGVNSEFIEAIPGVQFDLYPFSEVEGLIEMYGSKDINDNTGSTVYISTTTAIMNPEVPLDGDHFYISYRYLKSEEDYLPKLFYTYEDVVKEYGKYSITYSGAVINSLTLGAQIAFENGACPIVCVQAKSDIVSEMEDAIDKLAGKIEGLDSISALNSIVPLSTSKEIGAYLLQHVNFYSSSTYNKPRMGYLAAEMNEVRYKLPTISDQTLGSIQAAQKYNDERIVYVVPGKVSKYVIDNITGYNVLKVLPGCYLATAVAAIAMKYDVAEPLTNKEVIGFEDILVNYTEPEMNELAAAGCLVVKQDNKKIKIRHGITSHGCIDTLADIQSNEITLIQIKDYVIQGARQMLEENYIGGKMKSTIIHDVKYSLEQLFNSYVASEIILGIQGLTVKRDLDDPRQIDVKFLIEAVYPLNYIDIQFGFSTNIQ